MSNLHSRHLKMNEHFILLLILITVFLFTVITGSPSTPIGLFLHREKQKWKDAEEQCSRDDQRLVTIEDNDKRRIVLTAISRWIYGGYIKREDSIWIRLLSDRYQLSWSDSTELVECRIYWEHKEADIHRQICVQTNRVKFQWRNQQRCKKYSFICEGRLNSCWFDTYTHKSLTGDLVNTGLTEFPECKNACLTADETTKECVAFTFTKKAECLLLMQNNVYVGNNIPSMEFYMTATTSVKRCYLYNVTNEVTSYVDSSTVPHINCTAPTGPILPAPTPSTTVQASSTLLECSPLVCSCESSYLSCPVTKYVTTELSTFILSSTELSTSVEMSTELSIFPVFSTELTNVRYKSPIFTSSPTVTLSFAETSSQVLHCPDKLINNVDNSRSRFKALYEPTTSSYTVQPSSTLREYSPVYDSDSSSELSTLFKMSTELSTFDYDVSTSLTSSVLWSDDKSTSASTLLSAPRSQECLCRCKYQTTKDNMTSMLSSMIMNKTTLSSHLRKLTSATDSRPSSVLIGSVGCAILGMCFLILVLLDCDNLLRVFQELFQKQKLQRNQVP